MYNRHDMLLILPQAREYAFSKAVPMLPKLPSVLMKDVIFSSAPAIVTRQEHTIHETIQVGFSSHLLFNDARIRIRSEIPIVGIANCISPFDVIAKFLDYANGSVQEALIEMVDLSDKIDIEIGLFGSCALQLITSSPYMNEKSDIDMCIRSASSSTDFHRFYKLTEDIARKYGVSFDIEVICSDNAGVKLAELISESKTVLSKGLYEVKLQNKSDLLL